MKTILILVASLFLLCGCSTTKNTQEFFETSEVYIGGHKTLVFKNNVTKRICIYIVDLDKTYYIKE